jgi:hypothetical protein
LRYVPIGGSPNCCNNLPYNGQLPFPDAISGSGGTPNHKTERVANQIASSFFVHPDKKQGPDVYGRAVNFFNDQATKTGHQCVGSTDEALTASHGPIWWRAIMSLRITSWAIANGKVSWFSDSALENAILGWIQTHYEVSKLGEISRGPQMGKVLLPGARWVKTPQLSFPEPCPKSAPNAKPGEKYPADPMTDQVSNVMYQILKTGSISGVPWQLGKNFWILDPCRQDVMAGPLAKSALDNGLRFSVPPGNPSPLLHSQLVVTRYSNGHEASFPCGMADAEDPAVWAWADYGTGCLGLSPQPQVPPAPQFQGQGTPTTLKSVLPC